MRVVFHLEFSLLNFFCLDFGRHFSSHWLLVEPWWDVGKPVLFINEMVHSPKIEVIMVLTSEIFRLGIVFEILIFTVEIGRNVERVCLKRKQIGVHFVW